MASIQRLPRRIRLRNYAAHVWDTACEAPFAVGVWVYLVLVMVGVGFATYLIPSIDGESITPETLGIYVIGALIPVFAEALFAWKKQSDDQIAETLMVISFLLIFVTGYFASKHEIKGLPDETLECKAWLSSAIYVLGLILLLTVWMWGMLNVIEPKLVNRATNIEPTVENLRAGK